MRVKIVDLLATAPFYDRYLCNALAPLVEELVLYTTSFRHIPGFWNDLQCATSPGLMDVAARLRIRQASFRRFIRVIEYLFNWSFLLISTRPSKIDIIHIQWLPLLPRTSLELWFVRWIKRKGIPLVYTMHNLLPHDCSDHATVIERYRKVYELADALVVHTAQDGNDLIARFGIPQAKVYQIKHGAMQHEAASELPDRAIARQQLGWDDGWFVYLILGVIRPYKGIEQALRALAHVVEEFPGARLCIAGQGDASYVDSLKRLAHDLQLGQHVVWELGFVPSERVPLLHCASQVTMFPYRAISQSGAVLTAAGLGSFILSAQMGGLGELIRDGETGIGWHTQDPADLAQRMIECVQMGQDQRDRLAAAVQHLVLTEYSWDKIAVDTRDVYDQVLARILAE